MFVDCCYCKRASWKIGLESNELPSLNKEFTYLLTLLGDVRFSKRQEDVLQTYWTSQVRHAGHVILAGNENIHNISDEFEIRPDRTKDCGVSCP